MSRVIVLVLLLVLVACGGQPSEEAATAPAPAAPPSAPAQPAQTPPAEPPAASPAPEPAAAPQPAAPEAPGGKPVGSSSTKTGEPAAKKPASNEATGTKTAAVEKPAEPAPAPAPATSAGPCGEEGQPMCPLQAFMERFVQKPMDEGDLEAVAKGLARAAKLAPDPSWNAGGAAGWSAIAQAGVDAANAGDTAAAKQTCKTCHKAFRSKYKADFRTKPL